MRTIKKHIDSVKAEKYLNGFTDFDNNILDCIKKDISCDSFRSTEGTICINTDGKIIFGAEILKAIIDLNITLLISIWKLEKNDSEFRKVAFLKTHSKYYASTSIFNPSIFTRKYVEGSLVDNVVNDEKPVEEKSAEQEAEQIID